MQTVCVITDADKVGPNLCRILSRKCKDLFYVTTKDIEVGWKMMVNLKELGTSPTYHQLDVSDRNSVIKFKNHVQSRNESIVTIINNVTFDAKTTNTTYENAKFIIDNHYYGYINIQEILFPIMLNYGRVLYLSEQCSTSRVRNDYWKERLSMKHLRQSDINDFLQWFLTTMKTEEFHYENDEEDKARALYTATKVSLTLLVKLQQKQLASKKVSVNFLHPRWPEIY
ncbi:LOW QUALITY PROTEIN: carbonyl reductase [NADPH] 3-like [Aphomia sociella]